MTAGSNPIKGARVLRREHTALSPWVTVVERLVDFGVGRDPETYHAFTLADYVSILTLTSNQEVVMVRQYRPACEAYTLEFPGGLVEVGENPRDTVVRELLEETGYRAGEVHEIVPVFADPGRLGNRLHGYVTTGALPSHVGWTPEPGVEVVVVPLAEFPSLLNNGDINGLQLGIVAQAIYAGLIPDGRGS